MSLYRPVHDRFERFCRARVYGEMDHGDLINETLLLAYKKFDTLKSEQAFLSFLFAIAIRVLANAYRKKKPKISLEGVREDQIISSDNPEKDLDVQLLHEALALLPNDQRESLILFEISGFSIKEIAELHQVGESAVKQRLRRGRMNLAKSLTEKKKKGVETNE